MHDGERIVKLEDIGFIWSALDAQWEVRFQKLKAYKEERGHCNVPSAGGSSGIWVSSSILNASSIGTECNETLSVFQPNIYSN